MLFDDKLVSSFCRAFLSFVVRLLFVVMMLMLSVFGLLLVVKFSMLLLTLMLMVICGGCCLFVFLPVVDDVGSAPLGHLVLVVVCVVDAVAAAVGVVVRRYLEYSSLCNRPSCLWRSPFCVLLWSVLLVLLVFLVREENRNSDKHASTASCGAEARGKILWYIGLCI
ncbi:unnamed protein product [Pylaiella littoralis]